MMGGGVALVSISGLGLILENSQNIEKDLGGKEVAAMTGWILGPVIGSMCFANLGFRYSMVVSGVPCSLSAIVFMVVNQYLGGTTNTSLESKSSHGEWDDVGKELCCWLMEEEEEE